MRRIYFIFFIGLLSCFSVLNKDGWAAVCACPDYTKQYCCNPTGNCCSTDAAACLNGQMTCYGSGGNDECPSKCPYEGTYVTDPDDSNAEVTCVEESGEYKCKKRCNTGYYDFPSQGVSIATKCKECPANAVCPGDQLPQCNVGYYGEKRVALPSSIYVCNRCPSVEKEIIGAGMFINVYGKTRAPGATSVTACYLPEDSNYRSEKGKYKIVGSFCYYAN